MSTGRRARGAAATFPWGRMVRAGNRSLMTLDGTRSYLIGRERPLLIDPGPADEAHLQTILALLEGRELAGILLTHAHTDHAGNAEAVAERTGAPILMGRGAPRLPFPTDRVSEWLEDGRVLDCDEGPVEVHATPGHAREHLAFLLRRNDGTQPLFAGDLFLGVGDTTAVSHPYGDVGDYLRSLEVVARLRPSAIFPAHGPPLRRPERSVEQYRAHRLARIEQVREAVRNGLASGPEEITELVYGPDLDDGLKSAAVGSVAAILHFLASAEPE